MTVPSDLYSLPTLQQVLESRGDTVAETYVCGCCPRTGTANAFACMADVPGDHPAFLCWTCASGPHRRAVARQEAEALAEFQPWDTDLGIHLKVERDRRINASLWTTAAGSPLTMECRDAWRAWRTLMHRITLDFASPDDFEWPEEPPLTFHPET